jgi:hypothetical protein
MLLLVVVSHFNDIRRRSEMLRRLIVIYGGVLLKNADSFIESSYEIVKFISYFEGTLKSLTCKLDVVRIGELGKAVV